MHLLSEHPAILAALRAETDAVLGGDVAGWEHLPRLDLAARVVREALRLYPPAWAILASVTARWNLSPEAGTTVSPAARAVLAPRAFPVRLSGRGPSGGEAPGG